MLIKKYLKNNQRKSNKKRMNLCMYICTHNLLCIFDTYYMPCIMYIIYIMAMFVVIFIYAFQGNEGKKSVQA